MKKVIVIGCPGAGKSTFARKLNKATGLPLYYCDLLFYNADKTTVSKEVFDERLKSIISTDRWIIDGNYQRTLPMRFDACDAVFFLDYPMSLCLENAEKRIGKPRVDMPWVEDFFDAEFRQYIIDFEKNKRGQIIDLISSHPQLETHIFTSPSQADEYIIKYEGNI